MKRGGLPAFALPILLPLFAAALCAVQAASCASDGEGRAREYYSIGMAYFELGKYDDAELWLNRAAAADRTMTASEYNLGRIAFETGRYEDAAGYFERILAKDPDNVTALKAAAYSRIKNGDREKAEALYARVLALVPESADDGYNYALVLYSLEKYEACEDALDRHPFALEEDSSSLLLLARAQKAQNKAEAVNSYAKWAAAGRPDPQGLYEYARALEAAGLYARALEQYRAAIASLEKDTDAVKRAAFRFEEARLLLTADPDNSEGIDGLKASVAEGFSDAEAIGALLLDDRITKDNKDEIRRILDGI
jgi:tetratricopeptide (TPR) repeat protein